MNEKKQLRMEEKYININRKIGNFNFNFMSFKFKFLIGRIVSVLFDNGCINEK